MFLIMSYLREALIISKDMNHLNSCLLKLFHLSLIFEKFFQKNRPHKVNKKL